jgi:hypothetical protein
MVCCTATLHTPSHPKYDPEDKDVIMIRHSASHTTASILICQDPRIQNRPTQEGESVEGMKANECFHILWQNYLLWGAHGLAMRHFVRDGSVIG